MLKKALLLGVAMTAAAVLSAPASATVVASGGTTAASPSGWTPLISFSVPWSTTYDITITDCCIGGDYYATYVDGSYIGTTPYVPEYGSSLSTGTFAVALAAGSHTLRMLDQTDFYLPAGLSYSVATPEPATWAMMGLGFAGLAFAGYRSSRKTAAAAA